MCKHENRGKVECATENGHPMGWDGRGGTALVRVCSYSDSNARQLRRLALQRLQLLRNRFLYLPWVESEFCAVYKSFKIVRSSGDQEVYLSKNNE
ncbi:hypothetical protein Btru_076103 [Bulinus truncatus]|nr:hypothetical protein Btru_076103 [Bulinus truncatus]